VLAQTPFQPQHTNKLRDSWNQGILDFYTNHLITARFEFNKAGAANPQFRAPAAFLALPQMTAVLTPTPSTGGSKTPPATVPAAFNVWFPWIIVGTILLIAILILIVAMVLGGQSRRRQELATFEMDRAAAEQKAALEVQRQAVFFTKRSVNPANQNAQTKTDLRCPNCGQTVRAGDKFCSQCRSPLVLSDSGLHVRLATPQEIQGLPQAAINARRITELEHLEAEKQKQPAPPLVAHTNPAENVAQENYTQSLAEPLCPHCHKPVQINATFCANCGFSLSPSAGFQTRVTALPAIDADAFLPASPVSIQSPHDLAQEQVQEDKQQEEKASSRLGQRLGNYQLIRLLGEGGFAELAHFTGHSPRLPSNTQWFLPLL